MNPSRRHLLKLSSAALVTGAIRSEARAAPPRFHPTEASTNYKCLFNHELLIIVGKKENSPAYIGSFIDKLKGTDVDAVMCCPTRWRTNLYPSEIDPPVEEVHAGTGVAPVPAFRPDHEVHSMD